MNRIHASVSKPGSRRPDIRTDILSMPQTVTRARFIIAASILVLLLMTFPLFGPTSVRSNNRLLTPETGSTVPAGTGRKFVSRTAKTFKASVETDKADYAPGERVVMTGKGWKPGEMISLRIQRSDGSANESLRAKS